MNKRLEHCIQHHRSMIGFVVVLKLLEDPGNAPLGDVIHSCDVSEHSMLGIAPPAQNGILWGVSSHPGNTWGHHSTATCDSQQVRVSASLSSCVGTGRWTGELFNQPQPASFHWRPSSTLLTSQTKQPRHMSRHGKSLHFSHGDCTLVRWLNTSCLMQMCPSSLQRSLFWRQLHPVCPVNCCDWPCTDNTGTWHSSSKRELWRGTEQIKHPVLWGKQRLHKGDSH